MIRNFIHDESGASAAEYALILAIVTTGIAAATIFLGQSISSAVNEAAECIQGAKTLDSGQDCSDLGASAP